MGCRGLYTNVKQKKEITKKKQKKRHKKLNLYAKAYKVSFIIPNETSIRKFGI